MSYTTQFLKKVNETLLNITTSKWVKYNELY